MSRRTEISLKNFYIFNSTFAVKEGEEEKKILFYYPADTNVDIKIKEAGFTEALVKFTNTFTNDDSCKSLHTQKTTNLFYQPEKGFWMVMTINVPYDIKKKDAEEVREYKSEEVHELTYRAVLKQSYNMFRLFMGTFEMNFVGDSQEKKIANLVNRLEHFYSKYVLTLRLQNSDILDVLQSIQYLPLNQLVFLRVHNFIKMIESTFPTIKHSIFLYKEQVVWSGINPNDLYSVYEYLVGTLFPNTLSTELQGGSIPKRYSFNSSHYGGFITGSGSFENCVKVPKMYIFNDGVPKEYYLIVYKALSGILCLFFDAEHQVTDEFYQELHLFIGPQLTTIASEIGEGFVLHAASPSTNSANDASSHIKYLYFNELTAKHQSTVHIMNNHVKNSTVPTNVMNLLVDLYDNDEDYYNGEASTKTNNNSQTEETVIKAANDYWIIKKSSNARHFYVIINKNSTLMQIAEEAKKLYEQHIKNVFFDKN